MIRVTYDGWAQSHILECDSLYFDVPDHVVALSQTVGDFMREVPENGEVELDDSADVFLLLMGETVKPGLNVTVHRRDE
jgi:hypothetical protein